MKEFLKILSWINIIGYPTVSLILISTYLIKPFAWGDWLIAFNLFISIPFFTAAIISLKSIDHPNIKSVQTTLIFIFSILWLPSLALPMVYEFGGLLISLLLLGLGIWGIFKVKNPLEKLNYVNKIGLFVLLFNIIFLIGYLYEKIETKC